MSRKIINLDERLRATKLINERAADSPIPAADAMRATGATMEDIIGIASATHEHAVLEGYTEEVNIIVGSDFGQDCIGLCLSPEGDAIVGVLPGTPAADYGLDACAKRAGIPIDYDAIAERIRKVQEAMGGPFRLPDGNARMRATRRLT